jgi:hypothetical protein
MISSVLRLLKYILSEDTCRKKINKKNLGKKTNFFVGISKGRYFHEKKGFGSGSVFQCTDPSIRIHIKMARFGTSKKGFYPVSK